jgi:hypothetical protein
MSKMLGSDVFVKMPRAFDCYILTGKRNLWAANYPAVKLMKLSYCGIVNDPRRSHQQLPP